MLLVFSVLYSVTSSLATFLAEDLASIRTINDVQPIYQTWYPITDDLIRFSVHVGHDAWIALTSTAFQHAPKYEVLLGGNGNTEISILKNRNKILYSHKIKVLDPETYKDFWIRLENRHAPSLRIRVGYQEDTHVLIEMEEEEHIDINFIAIATTGDGQYGYWRFNNSGIDTTLGIIEHQNIRSYTTTTYMNPAKYFKMTDNYLRFYVQTTAYAHVLLTATNDKYPNYEVVFGTQDNEAVEIRIDENAEKTYFRKNILDNKKYKGFWIYVTRDKVKGMVICIGRIGEIKPFITYDDKDFPININYFAVSTPNRGGLWKFL